MPGGTWAAMARPAAQFLVRLAFAALLAGWVAGAAGSGGKGPWLAEALALLGAGLLLRPGGNLPAGWCAGLAACLPVHGLLVGAPLAPLLDLSLGVFLLGLALHGAALRLGSERDPAAPALVLCGFAALCYLPLWLGPWMEWLAGRDPAWVDAVLWACPAAHLAGLFDYDVLREQWFYQRTPFGMLRYDYPGKASARALLSALAILMAPARGAGPAPLRLFGRWI